MKPLHYDCTKKSIEPEFLSDCTIIHDFAEFANLPLVDVASRVQRGRRLAALDYQEHLKNVTKLEADHSFYQKSNQYIYDLLSANSSLEGVTNKLEKFLPGCMQLIQDHIGKTFLDFGAGLGIMCEIVARFTDKQVTYMDVESYHSEFAIWRFKKYDLPIEVQLISPDDFSLTQKYDLIFTDAVWEHLDSDRQLKYVIKLIDGLAMQGGFIQIIDWDAIHGDASKDGDVNMPMHYKVDIGKVHDEIASTGMYNLYGLYHFASVWQKKPRKL